jgi:uncharacterized protein (TIGR02265 family)
MSRSTDPASAPVRVPGRAFEILLGWAERRDPALRTVLRGLGYDGATEEYDLAVWVRALEVSAARVFPSEEPGAAHRQLGRGLAEGFLGSVIGGAMGAMIPGMGAERFLAQLPRFLKVVRPDFETTMSAEADRCWRVEVSGSALLPELLAGTLERAMEVAGAPAKVEVAEVHPDGYRLRVSW